MTIRSALFCAVFLSAVPAHAQLNYYYGNLHAHTGYSDGSQDSTTSGIARPGPAYAYAKQSYHFDFLGISEHNHSLAGMAAKSYYGQLKYEADTANQTGTFATLYGMEWGVIANGGHVLIYGTDSLVGWETGLYDIYVPKSDYASLWDALKKKPNIWASLAHPDNTDYDNIAAAARVPAYDSVIGGVAIRSGSATSTTTNYTDGAATSYESYFKTMLSRGYRVAPSIDHDNHKTTFGRMNKGRTVILASTLQRDTLLKALRQMRYYASDDWNAQLSFTVGGYLMGADVSTAANPVISVSLTDPDAGDGVSGIQIYSGVPGSGSVPTILTSNTGASSLSYTHTLTSGVQRYYYAKVTQSDGDVIWSAPVWVLKTAPLPLTLVQFGGRAEERSNRLDWTAAGEQGVARYGVERSANGIDFETLGAVSGGRSNRAYTFTDSSTQLPQTTYYRLAVEEAGGTVSYSGVVAVQRPVRASFRLRSLSPNPATGGALTLAYEAPAPQVVTVQVYDAGTGRQVQASEAQLQGGSGWWPLPVTSLVPGTYLLTVNGTEGRLAEGRFERR